MSQTARVVSDDVTAAQSVAAEALTVSVVIAMRNEERSIGACLDAIAAQDYPAELVEVIVVDGRSRDRSRSIVESYRQRDDRIWLLDNPRFSIPAGLNVGIRAARGAVIARVDARTRLAPDYLSRGIGLLTTTSASNVGGPVLSITAGFWARVLALVTESRFGLGGAAVRYRQSESREVDTVYLGLYPRRVLESLGLYDEELVRDQDDELNYRLRRRGGRILFSPALRTGYLNSSSVWRFVRQHFLYGYWKVRVCQKHWSMMSWRHLVPPACVLGLLVGTPLALVEPVVASVELSVLALYVVAASVAAVATGRRAGWRYVPALPAVFGLLHLAWGLGFLTGCLRFLPRWFGSEPLPPGFSPAAGPECRV